MGPTLVIIKANDRIFGGYASESWEGKPDLWKSDTTSFIYSLTNREKYPIISGRGNSIYNTEHYGPTFGWNGYHNLFCTGDMSREDGNSSNMNGSYKIPDAD